jgi:hypothetical protein
MFFTCMPGGSVSAGPASNSAITASGACSLRTRAYAAPVGPLPTMTTSTSLGKDRAMSLRLGVEETRSAHRPASGFCMFPT